MQYILAAIGICFAVASIVVYGAAAIFIVEKALQIIASPVGMVVFSVVMLCLMVYVIAKGIHERGFTGNIRAVACGEIQLWQAFWIYFFCLSAVCARINQMIFDKTPQHAEFSALVLVAVNVFVCYAAIASAIRQKKSFILFRGLAFFIAGIALVLNIFGVYVCVKDEIPLAEAIANPSDFYGMDQERIDAYKRGMEALTK